MLEMKKPLILWAVLANTLLLTPCSVLSLSSESSAVSSSSAWTSSSSSSTSSKSTSIVKVNKNPRNDDDCGLNERIVDCPFGVCAPKTCDDVGFPVACPDLLPNSPCPDGPGCICKENYVRNKQGICIPMKQCPSCGGDNNAVSGCGIDCNRLCFNYNNTKRQFKCPDDCLYNACECKQGFVFDEIKGKCVKPEECSTCPGVNEMYDPCPAPCPPQRCDVDPAVILCPVPPQIGDPKCEPGCRCIDGYVRNYTGNACIKREDCPICPQNEIYDICDAPCPPRRCDVDERLIKCAAPPKPGDRNCVEGCRCVDGYKRDSNGVCIPKEDCSICSGVNEIFDPCPAPCPPQRCDVDPAVILCLVPPQIGDPECEPGCRCIDGYVRNYTGNVCIKREDCPKCPQNEIYDICDTPCPPRRCDVDERLIKCAAPPEPGDPNCVEGCRCVDGYKRDSNGVCIPQQDCSKCTNPHEVYDPCPPTCPPQTCDSINKTYHCPNQPVGNDGEIIQTCEGQCVCELSYYRNKIGDCISEENCLPKCNKYERYDTCPAYLCQPFNCSQLGFPVPCLSYPEQTTCPGNPGCICVDGYVRDDNTGQCIRKEQCSSCGGDKNATSGCGVNCNKRCRDVGKKPGACIEICYENECDCNDGYYLDENTDQCVKPEDCSPVCPINEIYSECIQALCSPKNCIDLGFPVRCPRIDPKFCRKGCVCRDGKVRNGNGICVDRSECPSCGGDSNAQSGCGLHCNRRCSNIGQEPEVCVGLCYDNACDCKEGYYFDEDSKKCVLPNDCPKLICNKKNEYFNNCSNSDCSPQNCNEIGFPIQCTDIGDPSQCIEDCLCKEGYVRNNEGICVPSRECPSCGGDPNAVSGCGGYCNQKCSNIGKEPEACILICNVNACDCREGYYYDEVKKLCVLPSDCSSQQCPDNEYYSNCINGDCSVQNCIDVGFPISCSRIDPKYCKEGCLCNEGYARNEKGVCIPINECSTCKGDPNQVSGCGVYCNQKCSDLGKEPGPCILICYENSCDCREGFYLDEDTGRCVEPWECPQQCPENEYYNNCTNSDCSVQNCTNLGLPISCPRINPKYCKKGCLCKEGYARNAKGVCVPLKECPKCKGDPNRVSGCGIYCNQRCSDIGLEPGACIEVCYENECDCREGYYLDTKTDKCVPPEDCSSCKNDPNRVPGCGVYCNQRCADVGKEPGACITVCYENACDCKKGYYLDENIDKCVRAKDCSPVCGDNEVYSKCTNGGCDPKNCSQLGEDVPCVKLDPTKCTKGCLCKKGYLRDKNGVCVPESECKRNNLCPRPNEEYNSCFYNCPPQTCESLDRAYACPIREGDSCKAQCVCKEGFYRNKIGECISESDCRKCMGPHEYFSCGGACDNVCATIKKQNQTNCPIVNVKCNEMCYCEKNYARARNDTCIPIDKCKESQCGVNERYEECPQKLRGPFTCSQLGFPVKDNSKKKCAKPACVCVDGYVRDSNKVCIPKTDCPTCKRDPNRVAGCGVYCNQRCSDIGLEPGACIDVCYENECDCREGYYLDTKTDKCVLPENCTSCKNDPNRVPGCGVYCNQRCADVGKKPGACIAVCYENACDCKKGYYLDENIDKCVKAKDCSPVCGDNEVYSECTNGGCDPKNCSQLGKDVPCVKLDPTKCTKGCLCKKGYLRDKNGVCVPESECKRNLCPRPNEEYNSCFYNCPPQTCESLDRAYACPIRESDSCKAQCVCKEGFYRNKIGECIAEADCRKCMGPHEYFSCGGACDNVCATIKKQNQTNCPIINVKCNEMCYCEKNYARARNNTCIPIDKCKEPQCGVNERYEKCPQKLRGPFTCSQLGFPVKDNFMKKCEKPGCVCVDGFVRDSNKVCIPKTDCPSCGGDENAISGCGNCLDLCEDLGDDEPKFCTQICYENSCDCRDGYYYDKKLDKCVLPAQCTSICDNTNEYFENCTNPRCRAQTCDELGFPLNCSTDSSECKKGCYCKDGFVRNKYGKCIPVKDCPSCGGDRNAQSGCGVNCLKHCYDLANPKNPRRCKKICNVNGCDCKDGFYLDENTGRCVKANKCTPICGKDQVYDPCTNGGCGFRNCSQIGGPQICIDPLKCIKGCKCKQDYLRAKNGTCIPIEKCPEAKCPKKERFEKCPAALCQPQTCDDLGIEVPCLPTDGGFCPGGLGCVCENELVRNKQGKCIPKRQCPSCGGDPNAWSGCGVNCGKHCDDVFNKTRPCLRICYPNSCDCKDGFYYNDITGKCVKSSKCPPPCPENEQRDFCVNGYCGIRNCSQANGQILCVDPFECEIGCTCVEGYLRDDVTGVCVPECECPIPPKKCNAQKCVTCINCTEGSLVNESTAIANFELGNDLLNREFLYQLVKGRPGESFMFSAFSVLIALAQLTLYAVGSALDQLLRLLNLKSKDEIRTVFPILIKNYQAQESVIFELAIKYYGSFNHPFTRKFIEEAQGIFQSEGQSINFAENVEAADIINDWVRNRTNNLIDDLIDPSMLSEETRMVLVNALYFLGDWVYPFNPNETTPQKFYYGKSDNDVLSLPTMCQEKRFLYAESRDLDCQILRLPYKGQNFTFDIYLPRTRDGLRSMIKKIRNTNNIFTKTQELLEYQTVRACLPKMDIATDISNLSELLKMANLTAPFDTNSDGFKCIFEDESSVYISDAVQKSRIKVDETGTEATGIIVGTTSIQIPPRIFNFIVDHPCSFFIFNKNSMVFAGVFTGK